MKKLTHYIAVALTLFMINAAQAVDITVIPVKGFGPSVTVPLNEGDTARQLKEKLAAKGVQNVDQQRIHFHDGPLSDDYVFNKVDLHNIEISDKPIYMIRHIRPEEMARLQKEFYLGQRATLLKRIEEIEKKSPEEQDQLEKQQSIDHLARIDEKLKDLK